MQPAFSSAAEFIQMGGAHAPFVWSAWGISMACLLLLVWHARTIRHRFLREEAARQRRLKAQSRPVPKDRFLSSDQQDSEL